MSDWIASVTSGQYATAIMWTVGALVLLLIVLLLVRAARGFRSGTFIAGGRNRRPRLAVSDATAVDSTRRLVLVRRDDVEHLLLVGGPSDIVVEQSIRPGVARPQPANTETTQPRQQRDKAATGAGTGGAAGAATGAAAPMAPSTSAPQPKPEPPAPAAQLRREPSPQTGRTPPDEPVRTPTPASASVPEPAVPPRSAPPSSPAPANDSPATPNPDMRPEPAQAPHPRPAHATTPTPSADTQPPPQSARDAASEGDDPLAEDIGPRAQSAHDQSRHQAGKGSLEDEMSRLLEDISDERR